MKKLFALIMGAAVVALPIVASADTVNIGNLEKKPLKYYLRCGDGKYSNYTLNSLQYKHWTCANSAVGLQIGTNNSDGSVTMKSYELKNGGSYALVKPGGQTAYVAYDTNLMIVVVNTSTKSLRFSYSCSNVQPDTLTVASKDFGWIYAGSPPECSPYTAAIETNGNDGSTTTLTRPLALGNIYTLAWNSSRGAWDIQEQQQNNNSSAAPVGN